MSPEHTSKDRTNSNQNTAKQVSSREIPAESSFDTIYNRARLNPTLLTSDNILYLQRTIGNKQTNKLLSSSVPSITTNLSPIIQREITIGTTKYPSAMNAALAIQNDVKTAVGDQKYKLNLLFTILKLLETAKVEGLTVDRVIGTYRNVLTSFEAGAQNHGQAQQTCQQIFQSPENTGRLAKIKPKPGFQIINRGCSFEQALNIYNQKTMGGDPPNMDDRPPPTEKHAQAQTGDNIKVTDKGKLEEWSLNELKGFSSGGCMMTALVRMDKVCLPQEKIGEAGVTGWSDLPLAEVAIKSMGVAALESGFDKQSSAFITKASEGSIVIATFLPP